MKKRVFLLACAFLPVFSISSFAGELVQDDTGFRYINDDGSLKKGWHQEGQNGPWYYFGEDGYNVKGWMDYGQSQYYFRPGNGQMIADRTTTLQEPVTIVYRFDESGACTDRWRNYNGWLLDDVGWYYMQFDGSYATGWKEVNDKWYYFDNTGYMMTGAIQVDGTVYYLDNSGAWIEDGSGVAGNQTLVSQTVTGDWPYKPITSVPREEDKSDFQKSVDAMADTILASIVNDNMTQRQKAEAIYGWIRGNFRYSGHSATRDWVQEAYQGIRRRHGDCYTYFAVAQEFLTRCNIPCIEVIRYTDNDHYWNLIQLDDGSWYHFDTTPRRAGGYFCLWTDSQMQQYSASHGNCFAFDRSLYPATP